MISLVRAMIREATVTHGDVRDALRLDPVLMRAADMRPFEEVEIINHATGAHVRSWVEPASEASNEVHCPAARTGDQVTIVAYTLLHEGQTLAHKAKIVRVSPSNELLAIEEA